MLIRVLELEYYICILFFSTYALLLAFPKLLDDDYPFIQIFVPLMIIFTA